jgi:hypothetical protein
MKFAAAFVALVATVALANPVDLHPRFDVRVFLAFPERLDRIQNPLTLSRARRVILLLVAMLFPSL